MKRLVAITKQTQEFGIDTDLELNLIQEKDDRLTKEKLHNFTKKDNEGVAGGIFFDLDNDTIHLYVVETFWFKDVDPHAENELNCVAYVATRLHGDGTLEQPQYVEIRENATTADASINNVTFTGKGLTALQARSLDSAKKELAQKFDDFKEDMID